MNALEIAVTSAEQKVRETTNALAAAQREKASHPKLCVLRPFVLTQR